MSAVDPPRTLLIWSGCAGPYGVTQVVHTLERLLLEGIHQLHLLLTGQAGEQGHTVEEQLDLGGTLLSSCLDVMPVTARNDPC